MIKYYKEKKKNLHMVFIDLEKAYDKLPKEVFWWVLVKKGVLQKYIVFIKDMYDGVCISVRSCVEVTVVFSIAIGVHQESTFSPFLFATIIDELTCAIQEVVP
jgi:hypothetical protein